MSSSAGAPGELTVNSPYDGSEVGRVRATAVAEVPAAVARAHHAFTRQPLSPSRRREILLDAANLVRARVDDLARLLAREAGKPMRSGRVEVERCAETLRLSAEEAVRIAGEQIPIEASPGNENRLAFTLRAPLGVVAAVTPFNFPLNLVAHKIGPALAAGNTVVLKPAERTPLSALALAGILYESGLPEDHLVLLQGLGQDLVPAILAEARVRALTFTGSTGVGRQLAREAGLRRLILELGSNAGNIVHHDADLAAAAAALGLGGMAFAGQSCISVQRIFVHSKVAEEFETRLLEAVAGLTVGDPSAETTDVGPMISEASAERAEQWVTEAVAEGARRLAGGTRDGALLQPVVLAGVRPEMRVCREEVFAPVVTLQTYDQVEDAFALVNDSDFGLMAGIFTQSLDLAFAAARRLQVGGLNVNDASSFRADLMPYGGVKDSGLGREGPRYVVEELTELRTVTINLRV